MNGVIRMDQLRSHRLAIKNRLATIGMACRATTVPMIPTRGQAAVHVINIVKVVALATAATIDPLATLATMALSAMAAQMVADDQVPIKQQTDATAAKIPIPTLSIETMNRIIKMAMELAVSDHVIHVNHVNHVMHATTILMCLHSKMVHRYRNEAVMVVVD